MTQAERFQKTKHAILSVPPERAEDMIRQYEAEFRTRKIKTPCRAVPATISVAGIPVDPSKPFRPRYRNGQSDL